jgi:3-hydroxyisobutyrate dehydrogenase-like beta-hydroxyacid dehydrogenase
MSTPFHEADAIKAFISHIQDKHIKWHLQNAFQAWENASYAPNSSIDWKAKEIDIANQKYLSDEISLAQLKQFKAWVSEQV